MFDFIINLSRNVKKMIMMSFDIIFVLLAYFISLILRYDTSSVIFIRENWSVALITSLVTIPIFVRLGLYRAVLRFVTLSILKTVMLGVVISTISVLLISYILQHPLPRTIPSLYFIFLSILILNSRLFFKFLLNKYNHKEKKIPIVIYGAGDSGRQLLTALKQMPGYFVTAFVDDDHKLHNLTLHGTLVYSPNNLPKLIKQYGIQQILLAMPSVSLSRRKVIISKLSQFSCEVLSVPGIEEIVTGKAKLTTLNKVSIDDLLGRDPVEPINDLLSSNIRNKVVMVTGAGGSIGSELCRQIITQQPKALLLFEINEFSLYNIDAELRDFMQLSGMDIELIPILGSVQNEAYLIKIMRSFRVQTLYHAAAYKHVPLVEYNIVEGIRNNVFGTLNCAKAAIQSGVETFVLISTDKAVRPTNIMGTTKRIAELILQGLSKTQGVTRFCMVRFGNVLGSSGSVIPLFRKQIQQGGPITLTHADITRYFMTIPEASQLVIQAGAMGKGGDVFVLDMGEPIKILELAQRMIQLSGLKEKKYGDLDGDIEIKITGLRPGEKLYEELLIGDNVEITRHPRIMVAREIMLNWQDLEQHLNLLIEYCNNYEIEEIHNLLLQLPTAFNPVTEVCDLIWRTQ